MKTYSITITDGRRRDRFSFKASCLGEARRTAEAAHVGTGWHVMRVTEVPKN